MLHPDLQKLLDFALESGEVTEKHRQILHNKAIALNQDIDELEMIIEGEIMRLKKSKEGEKQKNYACPNCGASIPRSSIKCGYCGFEIKRTHTTGQDYIKSLTEALSKLDAEHASQIHKVSAFAITGDPQGTLLAQKKAALISTFTMPNDKEHLIEFFQFCDTNVDAHSNTSLFNNYAGPINQILCPAWSGKAKLGYIKLKNFANDDDEINELILRYKNKYHQESADMHSISINKNHGNGKNVMMGLNQGGVILFFILLLACFPLCWLPFVIPSFKA